MKTAVELLKENEYLREKLNYYIKQNEMLTKQLEEMLVKDVRPMVYVENNKGVISIE